MKSWDDNELPLAYLITFRTYGTWLHGDDRGSIDRYNNRFLGPRVASNEVLRSQHSNKLKSAPFTLGPRERKSVSDAIAGVCAFRGWRLYAINVRTNHVHIVTTVQGTAPDAAMRDFKAYATRELRRLNLWTFSHSPWVDGGSKRYLWKDTSLVAACDYVTNGQGGDLPESF